MDIFEGAVEDAQNEINNQRASQGREELPVELREELSNIESLVSMSPDVVNTKEYKDLMARIDAYNSQQASDDEEDDDDDVEDDEEDIEDSEDDDVEDDDEDEDEDEDDEEDDVEDVFGIVKGKNKKDKKVKLNFEVPKEMEELLSSRYGIKDASTFFGSVDTWRQQAQEGSEAKNQLDALTSDIQNLPPDLRTALAMWADGEDHTAVFTQGLRLDFSSDFEDQDVESLVEHYLGEQYSELLNQLNSEKIDEDEFNRNIDLLARSTKKMFNSEKKALVDQRAEYEKRQADLQKSVKSSALSSVESLSKSYPNFSKSELSKIRTVLVDGKVDSYIYNPDGTYKPEAAEMVANMMFGGKMRETIEKLAKRRGESEANQRIVDSSAKTLKRRKAANNSKGSAPAAVQHLGSVIVNDDPYSASMS